MRSLAVVVELDELYAIDEFYNALYRSSIRFHISDSNIPLKFLFRANRLNSDILTNLIDVSTRELVNTRLKIAISVKHFFTCAPIEWQRLNFFTKRIDLIGR